LAAWAGAVNSIMQKNTVMTLSRLRIGVLSRSGIYFNNRLRYFV